MYKLLVLLSLCVAIAYAAPGLLHATPILGSTSYLGWPRQTLQTVQVVRPIWPTHNIVRPIGHGYGWI